MKKRIVLCADDYGQALAISQGILALIKLKRLSAATCMVNSPFWPEHAKWIMPYQDEIDIGLHVNLTEGRALSPLFQATYGEKLIPLTRLMRLALLRQLNHAAILAECHAQVDCFEASLLKLPLFIDGHQHVHQFPIIREALIEMYKRRFAKQKAYIRWVGGPISLDPKTIIIYLMGAKGLKKRLEINQIPYNTSFAGIYSFSKTGYFQQHFRQFLKEIKTQGIIMCHPALPSAALTDAIAQARYEEYQYLAGSEFLKDCEAEEVLLSRFL